MNLREVRDIAYEFLALHGLHEWRFQFNHRKRTLGLCKYRTKTIELSIYYATHGEEKDIIDTIKHEIAHALVGTGHGHNDVWRAMAIKVGATPKACATTEVQILEGARYIAACNCGIPHVKYRKPRRSRYRCVKTKQEIFFKPIHPEGK